MCTAWTDSITANLLASASITGLGDTTLGAVADLDHFHRENSRHLGWMLLASAAERTISWLSRAVRAVMFRFNTWVSCDVDTQAILCSSWGLGRDESM